MKRLLVFTLIFGALVAHAQKFVCGTAKPGEVQLTASSIYSATTPGFDLGTSATVADNACSSDKPFFFSVTVPEGSYRVRVVLGGKQSSTTTSGLKRAA